MTSSSERDAPDPASLDALRTELRAFLVRVREQGGEDAIEAMRVELDAALQPPGSADDDDTVWHGMVGAAPSVIALRDKISKFARAPAPVLIRGESGTGKDLVARILHELGRRSRKPFVAENCAAIPETLLESVLFGHARGSFTGAVRDHDGHFVAAHGGTLFLDEIGDTPLAMQVKLLRALQEGEVRPVGSEKVKKVDVRVIAATNRDLEQLVREGRFRQDLFYRLNVLEIWLPPLRERGGDVILLARRLLAAVVARGGRPLRFSPAAEECIQRFAWPGNVRQLQNEVQRLAALADGPEIQPADLSPEIAAG